MRKLILAITTGATLLSVATAPADARHRRHTTHYYSHRTRACPGHSGTTGAIVGGGAGALVGHAVAHGIAGPVIGGVGGALLGRHIGRHTC
jgi:hypothetical protein